MNEMLSRPIEWAQPVGTGDRLGGWLWVALLLAAFPCGLFVGAYLFPHVVEVPVTVEKQVTVRDDKAIADATQHIRVLKSTVKSLHAQVALLQARAERTEAVPLTPIALATDAAGLARDARAILGEFGVSTVQVKECR